MLTEVDTNKLKYSSDKVWRLTLTRMVERCNALHFTYQLRVRRARLRGTTPPNPTKLTRALTPLARVDADGGFHYTQPFISLIKRHLGDNLQLDQAPESTPNPEPSPTPSLIAFVKPTEP